MQMRDILDRLSEPDPNSGCRLWLGAEHDGYGYLSFCGQSLSAHRASYELASGPIPKGMGILHKCNTKLCIREDHLYAGTNRQNVDDRLRSYGCDPTIRIRREQRDFIFVADSKRQYRKSGNPRKSCAGVGRHGQNKILTADQVREIRKATSVLGSVLADRYGVSRGTISKIRRRQLWATLPD